MLVNEKKDKVVSIRMSEEDFMYLKFAAFTLGLSPSRLLRMLCDSSINSIKLRVKQGDLKYEDIKAVFDN